MRREDDGQTVNTTAEEANLGTVLPRMMGAAPSGCTGVIASQANLWRRGRSNGDGDSDGLRSIATGVRVIVRVVIVGSSSSRVVVSIVSLVVAFGITVGVVAS